MVYETNVFAPVRVEQVFLALLKSAGTANAVMVSSGLGSKGWLSDPQNEFYGVNFLGYNSSKSALNAVALSFCKELAASGIKVNAADPGFTDRLQRPLGLSHRRAGCKEHRHSRNS
jgi:NAD(P)-dependent dehydrogenase (short-subunit alcohol dehydrogenase family)